ncbi:hypothetical protein NM688_g6919 [Phlebia brevispora]|uniref:Uncharacterized protein n=1 Tax=Phlebia brevispora TaxID=194682 RepID=A0ACC1SB09_9APHY|nr:hypothetical protein NM688_g6919 [Phlebia brevispora]
MAIESLPREIVDYVVTNLSQKRDLSSVSLVSSYLSASARPLLFADLCLSCDPSEPNNALHSFIAFLSSSHDICDFVHSLTLQTKQSSSGSSLPLVSFKLISKLLSKLLHLKDLHLKNIGFCWHDGVPTDAYQARYSLQRLSLTNATGEDDIAPLLEMFKTIGELTIINESFFFTARVSAWREGHERNRTAQSFLKIFQRAPAPDAYSTDDHILRPRI